MTKSRKSNRLRAASDIIDALREGAFIVAERGGGAETLRLDPHGCDPTSIACSKKGVSPRPMTGSSDRTMRRPSKSARNHDGHII